MVAVKALKAHELRKSTKSDLQTQLKALKEELMTVSYLLKKYKYI